MFSNEIYTSYGRDFAEEASASIDLHVVHDMKIEEIANMLINLGVFRDETSIKLYLATSPLQDIREEIEVAPITYEKWDGIDESEIDEAANHDNYNLRSVESK